MAETNKFQAQEMEELDAWASDSEEQPPAAERMASHGQASTSTLQGRTDWQAPRLPSNVPHHMIQAIASELATFSIDAPPDPKMEAELRGAITEGMAQALNRKPSHKGQDKASGKETVTAWQRAGRKAVIQSQAIKRIVSAGTNKDTGTHDSNGYFSRVKSMRAEESYMDSRHHISGGVVYTLQLWAWVAQHSIAVAYHVTTALLNLKPD